MDDIRTVVISGATKGIGAACALHLDRLGFRVFAGYRSETDAEWLRARASSGLTPVRLDVTDGATIAQTAEIVRAATGDAGLWGVVNNAAIVVAGPLEVLPIEEIRHQFEVNVMGALRLTQVLIPLLRQGGGGGRIVNISSVNGRLCTPYSGPYSASKFALEALSDALRFELRRWAIEVSIVEPGAIRTPLWDASRKRALRIAQSIAPESKQLYRRVFDRLNDVKSPTRALAPERVAHVVAQALLARHPRTRYQVGWDARVGVLIARLLPGRLIDLLLAARRR